MIHHQRNLSSSPKDVDYNGMAYSVFHHASGKESHHIMDQMPKYVDSEGIPQGYFTHEKVRLDILMCVNRLALFNEFGRGHELAATEDWIYEVWKTRSFRDGTHYYPSPDVFLYFVSRMLMKGPHMRE